MINERRPMPRSRHNDIQHFAIQEWRAQGVLKMFHMAGAINPSDDLTKALGWALHSRHARRSMGHYKIGSPNEAPSVIYPNPHARAATHKAGEGVGDQSVRDSSALVTPRVTSTVKNLPGSVENLMPASEGGKRSSPEEGSQL